jgi:exopolyphosphatase / guanosine-5'-triphosphate,3'-diphosphate pyrophosphatase
VKHFNREMGAYLDQLARRGFDRVIGTSGTILSLGALAIGDRRRPPAGDVRNRRVPAKALRRLRKRLTATRIEQRLAMPGLDPRRADLASPA